MTFDELWRVNLDQERVARAGAFRPPVNYGLDSIDYGRKCKIAPLKSAYRQEIIHWRDARLSVLIRRRTHTSGLPVNREEFREAPMTRRC